VFAIRSCSRATLRSALARLFDPNRLLDTFFCSDLSLLSSCLNGFGLGNVRPLDTAAK
jgi:hypothetical protein